MADTERRIGLDGVELALRHGPATGRLVDLGRAEVEALAGAADAADWSFRAQRLGLQPRGSLPMDTPAPLRHLLRLDWRVARPARRAGSAGAALIVAALGIWLSVQAAVGTDQPAVLLPGLALTGLVGLRVLRRAPAPGAARLDDGPDAVVDAVRAVLSDLDQPLSARVASRPCVLVDGDRVVRNVDLPLAALAGWRRRLVEGRAAVGELVEELAAGEALLRELASLPASGGELPVEQGERRVELTRQRLHAEALVRDTDALLPRLDAARLALDPLLEPDLQTLLGPDLAPLLRDCLALDERIRLVRAHGPPTS